MSNLVFPVLQSIEYPVMKTPQFNTTVQKSKSGRRVAIQEQTIPLWKWKMSFSALRSNKIRAGQTYDDYSRLMGFFLQVGGSFDSFLYSDPTANTLTNEQISTGNGVNVGFQIARTFGGYVEPLYEIVAGLVVKVNGVTKTLTTDYTINSSGVITFVVAPPNTQPITVTGTYMYRCCFPEDYIDVENFNANLWATGQVEIESQKP
jgi:uncharacterized protein (TIGR02217 family)